MVDQIEFMLPWNKTLCRHTENNNDDWNDTYHNTICCRTMAKHSDIQPGVVR
jgi:hypothetical protein